MKKNNKEVLLKSKPSKIMVKRVRFHFIVGGILVILSLVVISNLIMSLISNFSTRILIYVLLLFLVLILSAYLILYGIQIFFPFVLIFEENIIIRKPVLRTFIKSYLIPYTKISNVEIKKEIHSYYSKRILLIDTTSHGKFNIDTRWVLNYNEVKNMILNKIEIY